jgi:hypothetical protein
MEWINLAQDRDSERTVVNSLVNLLVPQSARSFLIVWRTTAFQEALYIIEFVMS